MMFSIFVLFFSSTNSFVCTLKRLYGTFDINNACAYASSACESARAPLRGM